tara:strand:- start:24 stop:359 length:336 start_codon:yes stop_codon:yes gene_type:complete
MKKQRCCRDCKILLSTNSSLQHKRKDGSVKDGAICRYCWKVFKMKINKENYENGAFDYKLKDPEKIICSECSKSLYTTIVHKKTCSLSCSNKRNVRLKTEKRKKKKEKVLN